MKRRKFIRTSAMAATATFIYQVGSSKAAAEKGPGVTWPIGCLNRPWAGDKKNWGYDAALDGIKAAGYKVTGLLTRSPKEPFTGSDATPEYLAALKQKIAAHGLKVNMAALRTKDELPLDAQIKDMR